MFLLVRHLTGHAGAGAVAALLYAFSHYRFGHLSHVQLLSYQWLPLMLVGLHRCVTHGGRWRDVTLTAVAFAMQALSSGYYAYFAAVALGLFIIWSAAPATRPSLGRVGRRAAVAAAVVALLLTPVFLPYYLVRRELTVSRSVDEIRLYSARPTSYLATPPGNRWLGEVTRPFRRPEGELFPGAVMLFLAMAGAVTVLGRVALRSDEPTATPPVVAVPTDGLGGPPARHYASWLRGLDFLFTVFLVLTLANAILLGGFALRIGPLRVSQRQFVGPFALIVGALAARRLVHGRPVSLPGLGWLRRLGWPHAAGYYVGLVVVGVLFSFGPTLMVGDTSVEAPLYRQLYRLVPGFDGLRVPARFAMLVSTGLAVLAGYGVAALAGRIRGRGARVTAVAALGGLAVLESWTVPLSYQEVPEMSSADRWLAAAPAPGPVVILPLTVGSGAHLETQRLLGSTLHWRPLVNGYSSFFPQGYWDTVETLNAFPTPPAVARLRALGVRYVVVYFAQYPDRERRRIRTALETLPPGIVEAAALEGTAILEVRPPP